MFDDALDGVFAERQQLFLIDQVRNQVRKCRNVDVRALQLVVEIRRNLEKIAELVVVHGQDVIEPPLTDQDDLDVQRNGFGFQRGCAHETPGLTGRFDPDLLGEQCLLQCIPDEGSREQAMCVQDKVTAVGVEQSARPDESEVGHEGAHLRTVFDLADDVVVRRVRLEEDGRDGIGFIADAQIDFVLTEKSRRVVTHEGQGR